MLGGVFAGDAFGGKVGGFSSYAGGGPDSDRVDGVIFEGMAGAEEDGGGAVEAG